MAGGEGAGDGGGRGNLCPGLLWATLWFFGLWLFAWPVGFLIAWLYVLLIPFSACVEPLKDVCDAILKIVTLPLTFAQNMLAQKPCCS